jgi:hypothetical protein
MITRIISATFRLQSGWTFARRTIVGTTSETCADACLYNDADSPLSRIDGQAFEEKWDLWEFDAMTASPREPISTANVDSFFPVTSLIDVACRAACRR